MVLGAVALSDLELLRWGELPPPEFTRPEVARVLAQGLAGSEEQVG